MRARRGPRLVWMLVLLASGARAAPHPVSPREASRFLAQATLGVDFEEIERTAAIGPEAWIAEQFERPIGRIAPPLAERRRLGLEVTSEHRRQAWWTEVMRGPDPLRQRVALALSELLVVSDNLEALDANPEGLASYYDMLLENAFGNYRDLLYHVTLHPVMGAYLSHLRNEKSDRRIGRFPDENYAREVMQLFSIGLYRLHPDGTFVQDGAGRPLPTYDNGDITEFAKIFTGLSFDAADHDFHDGEETWTVPMRMYEEFHEPGEKRLLRGRYVPPGQPGMRDIEDALDDLFEHPNIGPFVARRLIQRLVTSNPSRDYVRRVASAFADDGRGVRGSMKAVLRAILLDPEARALPGNGELAQGRLRESFLRRVHLARAFDAHNRVLSFPISDPGAVVDFGQRPLSSPTVFNFFLPDHQPSGPIARAGLYAPEFQIVTAVTAITSANELRRQVDGAMNDDPEDVLEVRLDLHDEIGIASDVGALVDRLDLILMHDSMSAPMRGVLVHALLQLQDPEERARMAIHLIAISPEYNVLR